MSRKKRLVLTNAIKDRENCGDGVLALLVGVTMFLVFFLTLLGCDLIDLDGVGGLGDLECCSYNEGYAYMVAERALHIRFVDPPEIGASHRWYRYMRYSNYFDSRASNKPIDTLFITSWSSLSLSNTGYSDIDNTHDIPIFVFLDYLAPEEGRWAQQSAYGELFDIGGQTTPPFVSSEGYNYFQFPAALALYHQKYCPEVSGTGISDNTADSGYYTFLDQCEGVIVIKPGETKPFHYNGYGNPRE